MRKASAMAAITASSISTPGAIMLELPDSSRWDSFAHIAQLPLVGREVRVQKGGEPRSLRRSSLNFTSARLAPPPGRRTEVAKFVAPYLEYRVRVSRSRRGQARALAPFRRPDRVAQC